MEDEMICLDTNYLIQGLVAGTAEAGELISWHQAGEPIVAPMPAWLEFLCGPVTGLQVATMRAFLREIVSFGEAQATEAARLFNAASRRRGLSVDAMIAGTATSLGALLATRNVEDFSLFEPHGLRLVKTAA